MKVKFTEARTFEGTHYPPGEYDILEVLAKRILHTFPNACAEVQPKRATKAKATKSMDRTTSAKGARGGGVTT